MKLNALLSKVLLIAIASAALPASAALEGILLAPQNGQPAKHLAVLLHGYGSNEQDLLPLSDALASDYAVLSLRAPQTLGGDRYAWYREGKDESQDIDRAREEVVERIHQIQRQLGVAPSATLVAGFSQGAVMSWSIALQSPTVVGGAAIFSGRLPANLPAQPLPVSATTLPNMFVGHGQVDNRIAMPREEQAVAVAKQRGYRVSFHRYATLGHGISSQELKDFSLWSAGLNARTPSS